MGGKLAAPLPLWQFILLVHGTQVGMGIVELPSRLAEKAGTDGWIAILCGGALSTLAGLLILGFMERYPGLTLPQVCRNRWGRQAGVAANCLAFLYSGFFSLCILLRSAQFFKHYLLPDTSLFVVVALLSIPGYLVMGGGFRVLGRFAELAFLISVWMGFLLVVPLLDSYPIHLLPVFKNGVYALASAVYETFLSYLGFELMFLFHPWIPAGKKARLGLLAANGLTTLVYLALTLVAFMYFSPDEITLFQEPALNLLKVIEFRFFERLEVIMLSLYVFYSATTWMPYMLCAASCSAALLSGHAVRSHLLSILWICVAVAYIVEPSFKQSGKWLKTVTSAGIGAGYVLPFVLVPAAWMLHRAGRRRRQA